MEKIFAGARQETGAETDDRAVVGSFLPGKRPHTAGFLPLAE